VTIEVNPAVPIFIEPVTDYFEILESSAFSYTLPDVGFDRELADDELNKVVLIEVQLG
jgi:hypothetical protein